MNVFFGIINQGYSKFTLNFMKRWKELEIKEDIFFVCLDKESYFTLSENNIKCVLHEKNLSKELKKWNDIEYKDIVFEKLNVTNKIINEHKNSHEFVTYIDTDIWINLDFTKELQKILNNNNYDIIFQDGEDYVFNTEECSFLEEKTYKLEKLKNCISYCTGFMAIRTNCTEIKNLFSYKKDDLSKFEGNQDFINSKLENTKIKYCNIPKKIFPNFSTSYFFQDLKDYWMLHYTYLVGKEKIYYMKKYNHWVL